MSKSGLTAVLCLLFAGALIAGQSVAGIAAVTGAPSAQSWEGLDPDHAPEGVRAQQPDEGYPGDVVTWSTRASKPGSSIYCPDWGSYYITPDSSFFFCIGGQSPYQTACYRYNSNANTWWQMANRPQSGCNMTSVYWEDDGGGSDSSGVFILGRYAGGYYTTCQRWWKASNTWTTFTTYGSSQSYAGNAAVVIGDSIFLKWNNTSFSRYSIREGTWASRPTSGMTGTYYGSAVPHLGKAYFGGGWSNVSTFQCYDPATATWSTKASIPSTAGGNRPMMASWDVAGLHRIYCYGGGSSWTAKNGVHWYDAGADEWTAEGTMPTGRLGSAFGPVQEFPDTLDMGINFAAGYNSGYQTSHYRGEPEIPQPNDVGVTMIIEPDDPYYAFGDTLYPQAQVKNWGTAPQTDVPVRCIIKDKATGTEVYNEVVTLDLAIGQIDTADFPLFYPDPVETLYVDTMRTELVGDAKPSNDWQAGEIKVTQWGSECLTYNDGTFDNAYSWVAAGNELCVRFFAPTKPLPINKVELYLSSFSGADYAAEIRVYANNGTPYGYPGDTLGLWVGDLHTEIWTSLYLNEIYFTPSVQVTYDTFFVSYYQTSITPAYPYLGVDYTPPVTTGNDWGKYGGVWGAWPYDASQDFGINACYEAPLIDGSVVSIQVPPAEIDSNTTFTPQVTVQNAGLKDRSNMVVVFDLIDSLDMVVFTDTVNTGPIGMGEGKIVDFALSYTPHPGDFTDSAYTIVQWDGNPDNDWFVQPLFVKHLNVLTELVSPRIQEVPGLVPVRVKLVNMGNVPVLVPRVDVTIQPSGYADYRQDIPIGVGEEQVITLNPWVCPAGGHEVVTAWITYPEDMYPPDDTMIRNVTTGIPGWTEMTAMPAPPSGKSVKNGGTMAYDAGTDLIYASKGYKTGDFYAYDVPSGTWATKAGWPLGAEGKGPYKGSVICSDGNGKIYGTKGNNTVGFWNYDAEADAWTQLTNVPFGGSGKKVKQGAGIAWAVDEGVGAVYLLKGYRNEFYKYDPEANDWTYLLNAPIGVRMKWDDGSWIVYDGESKIYAHKAKYHEFYYYDLETDLWSPALHPMPIPGSSGRNKKSKYGGCAAWYGGKIYALKGGNTNEFWRYFPETDTWQAQDDIPLWGTSGRRKKVKYGAAMAGYPGTGVYAFKGNKTLEFWRYTPYDVAAGTQPRRDGVTAGSVEMGGVTFAIVPNPLSGGLATLRYSLPKAGLATLTVFDVSGRTVLKQTLAAGRAGSAGLDLRQLEAGVYLAKVTTEGFSATQKLVVEH